MPSNKATLEAIKGTVDILHGLLKEVIRDTKINTSRLDKWNGSIVSMEGHLNQDLAEVKASIDKLATKDMVEVIDTNLTNHLHKHDKLEEKTGDRVFKLIIIGSQVLIGALLGCKVFM